MHALLFAVALTIGTVKAPANNFEIDREVTLEDASDVNLTDYRRKRVGAIEFYTKSTKASDDDPEPELDIVLAAAGRRYQLQMDGGREDPTATMLVPGIVAITQDSTVDSRIEVTTTAVIDLRGKPRALVVTASSGGRGNCGVFNAIHSFNSALACDWSATRDDFVCSEARVLRTGWASRVAWRRWTLFDGKPITSATDLTSPKQLLARKRAVITGLGTAERIPLGPNRDLLLIPPTGHRFTPRGWVVDYARGTVIPAETIGFDVEGQNDADTEDVDPMDEDLAREAFTPDREPIEVRILTPISANVTPVVIEDGRARALFWLGYDGEHAALLRIATNAEEYVDCGRYRHPASASSISGTALRVESAWISTDDGYEAPPRVLTCPTQVHVRWDHGFVIERGHETACPESHPVTVEIGDDGTLTTKSGPP